VFSAEFAQILPTPEDAHGSSNCDLLGSKFSFWFAAFHVDHFVP
jgi:hypothetical protein